MRAAQADPIEETINRVVVTQRTKRTAPANGTTGLNHSIPADEAPTAPKVQKLANVSGSHFVPELKSHTSSTNCNGNLVNTTQDGLMGDESSDDELYNKLVIADDDVIIGHNNTAALQECPDQKTAPPRASSNTSGSAKIIKRSEGHNNPALSSSARTNGPSGIFLTDSGEGAVKKSSTGGAGRLGSGQDSSKKMSAAAAANLKLKIKRSKMATRTSAEKHMIVNHQLQQQQNTVVGAANCEKHGEPSGSTGNPPIAAVKDCSGEGHCGGDHPPSASSSSGQSSSSLPSLPPGCSSSNAEYNHIAQNHSNSSAVPSSSSTPCGYMTTPKRPLNNHLHQNCNKSSDQPRPESVPNNNAISDEAAGLMQESQPSVSTSTTGSISAETSCRTDAGTYVRSIGTAIDPDSLGTIPPGTQLALDTVLWVESLENVYLSLQPIQLQLHLPLQYIQRPPPYTMFKCDTCGKELKWKKSLLRHIREQHEERQHQCVHCGKKFQRFEYALDHAGTHRKRPSSNNDGPSPQLPRTEVTPTISDEAGPSTVDDETPMISVAGPSTEVPSSSQQELTDGELHNLTEFLADAPMTEQQAQAFRGFLTSYKLTYPNTQIDPEIFLNNMVPEIHRLIAKHPHRGIKLWICLVNNFEKATDPAETIQGYFCSKQKIILPGSDKLEAIRSAFPEILTAIDSFEKKGSGWVIRQIQQADIHFSIYQPLRGSSYKKLPPYIENKKAVVNVQNSDNQCLKWAVLAALHPLPPRANSSRISNYINYADELDFEGIPFPVPLSKISKFERQNQLSVNVYGYEEKNFTPLYISTSTAHHIDLLLYEGHYCWIKSLDALLFDQRKDEHRKYFCPRCLIPKYSEEARTEHLTRCGGDPTRVEMPKETELKFENTHRTLRQPLVVYADFECLTEPVQQGTTKSQKYQHHTPCGYGLIESLGCCRVPSFTEPSIYRGPDAVRKFLVELVQIGLAHQERINNAPDINMTELDRHTHNSNQCHVCKKTISDIKTRDHCHICGIYRGPAHVKCNLAYRIGRDVTVVFHNLRRYDGHLIMQELGTICKDMGLEIEVIAKTMEDYIGFSITSKPDRDNGASTGGDDNDPPEEEEKQFPWKLRFIDSFQFLTNSLEGLVANLDKAKFKAMESQFEGEELTLLLRKGVFPYDWLNKWDKFDYPLPQKAQFYSKLNNENISDEDYTHAKKVWQTFDMHNMGEYHDLYLKTDVLLLADVFEEFRAFCLENYKLDPAHYLTLPSFAWDACLKMTKAKLDLLQDPEMYTFLESGIRGGISMISHRYAKANNPLLDDYDASKPTSYITYLDANNLYGWSMIQALPTNQFQWQENVEALNWRTMSDDGSVGCILEVDLDYPEALHDAHNSYPLAAERLKITNDLLSPYCSELKLKMDLSTPPQEKLVPNLLPKSRYVVHYRNLKLYEAQGLIVTKIHRILTFKQSPWMRPYIEFNTEMRKQARTSFEKDLFKLLNNAVYGKTMENVRAYADVKMVTSDAQFRKQAANPRYQYSSIFTEDLVAVKMQRVSTCLCKPIYVGFTVLELSKELMYNFHYSHIVPKYGDQATLLFTDTDSLCYQIETSDIYEDMLANSNLFDTSDYPPTHPLHSNVNKKVLGKMKDETAGSPISEFCGLRSKMYSFMCDNIEKKRAKGIKKGVVKNVISHADYKNTLFGESSMQHSMNLIRSDHHKIYSMTLTKKSLSAYDDKRYLMDSVSSFAYGHVATI